MSIAPQPLSVGTGSVHVVGDSDHRMVLADGMAVEVIASYPVRPDVGLYSLATVIGFRCAECCLDCEATLVAVREAWLLCPGCYGASGGVGSSGSEDPNERNAA